MATIRWSGKSYRLHPASRLRGYLAADLAPRAGFDRRSFRTKFLGGHGKRLLVACPKGSWSPSKEHCRSGMEGVQLFVPRVGYNKSRYTVRDAPRHVRRRWARLGQKMRLKYKPFKFRIRGLEHDLSQCEGALSGGQRVSSVIPEIPAERYKMLGPEVFLRKNPELVVVNNPEDEIRDYVSRWTKNPRKRRKGGTKMRRRRKNRKVAVGRKTIRYRGRKTTWRGLVKRCGVMGAKRIWRKSKKSTGSSRSRRRGKRKYRRNAMRARYRRGRSTRRRGRRSRSFRRKR